MTKKRRIVFFIRAYNDMDTQMPLVYAFAKDPVYDVTVMGFPCDGFMGLPNQHEAVSYLKAKYGAKFQDVLSLKQTPIGLKILFGTEQFIAKLRKNCVTAGMRILSDYILKYMHVFLLYVLKVALQSDLHWLKDAAKEWDADFVVIDAVASQPDRSYLVDEILPIMREKKALQYVVLTGHNIYQQHPNPQKKSAEELKSRSGGTRFSGSQRFFVPAELDKRICAGLFPFEKNIDIVGNARMDPHWVDMLRDKILVAPFFDKDHLISSFPDGKLKVAFMLSKMTYGVQREDMRKAISAVTAMDNVATIIKPHTRGMKFDLMAQDSLNGALVADHVPSSLILEWADIVLFTGSSIVFHAMALEKEVGFMKFCQSLETIFDDGVACHSFEVISELTSYLKGWRDHGKPVLADDALAARAKWRVENIYGGLNGRDVAAHCKEVMESDLKAIESLHEAA